METIAMTLSIHERYEGYGTPETILFEPTKRESIDDFMLRVFRNILSHHTVKYIRRYRDGYSELFVSLNSNTDPWIIETMRTKLKSYFASIRIQLIGEAIH